MGSTPIGGPIVGWISQEWDARAGLMVGAVATALVTVWTAQRLRRDRAGDEPTPDELTPDETPVAAATVAA